MQGYMGKLAYINLTTGIIEIRELDQQLARQYIGGSALAAGLAYNMIKFDTDPLGPDNPLFFMTGPMVGTMAPSSSRFAVCARSPLTGIWGESTSGGIFGNRLKAAGLDGLVITGRSPKPVYIKAVEGAVTLEDAEFVWGRDSYQAQSLIKDQLGKVSVATIGLAGENLVPMAAVMNDEGRAAGRCGLGAVMGSKNLKAIAAGGSQKVQTANQDNFSAMVKFLLPKLQEATGLIKHFGTLGYLDIGMYFSDVPAKYFTESIFQAEKVTSKKMKEDYKVKNTPCLGCLVACGKKTYLTGKNEVPVDGPEYESVVALGPLCGSVDLESAIFLSHLCNVYGMDTISSGVSIAFAMYLLDRGLVTKEQLGFEIAWGDTAKMEQLLGQMADNQGCGSLLASGTRKMAQTLGVDPGLAAHVKGLEIPMHDPRAFAGQALCYATGVRGACHQRGDFYSVDLGLVTSEPLGITAGNRFQIEGRANVAAKLQNIRELDNAFLRCTFASLPIDVTAMLLSLITGEIWTVEELDLVGERSIAVKRAINCTLGITRQDDSLPAIVTTPYTDGGAAGFSPDLGAALKEYYTERRWDWDTGRPMADRLEELGIK